MTEAELQAAIVDLAHLLGWRVAHFRAAKTSKGWRTPVQGDASGFVDLVLVRPAKGPSILPVGGRVIFAELKGDRGRISPDQQAWADAIKAAGGEHHFWWPTAWTTGRIEGVLR